MDAEFSVVVREGVVPEFVGPWRWSWRENALGNDEELVDDGGVKEV